MILIELFNALWFFLPAGIANAIPVLVSKLPILKRLNYPLDFNRTYKGIRIFGDHKTIRGLISGIIFAILIFLIQQYLYTNNEALRIFLYWDYTKINPFIFGLLSGLGALLGDAFKSFFKRRTNIKPGESWFPFDQIDFIIGGCVFLTPYIYDKPIQYISILFVYFLLHLISTFIGFLIKLKDKPI
jgi:CDP-2,3-bis-(O-geranylgeranyl)-sn-glycerol synthase